MMTIDEAIAILKYKYGDENKQLAEWLEELKAFKENKWTAIYFRRGYSKAENDYYAQSEKDRQSSYDCGYEVGYAKAIDVACEYLKCEWAVDNLQTCDDFDKIAEQLKAGEQNERSVSEDYRENK